MPAPHQTPTPHQLTSGYADSVTPGAQQQQQAIYNSQWGFQHNASPYPDVSSYQQPYFYQQTDPSTYNSPWPPAVQDANASTYAATPAPNYSSTNSFAQQQSSMPFFPQSQTQVEQPPRQTESYEVTGDGTYQSYPDLDGPPQYNYAMPQVQSRASRAMADFYFEDASMHLKLQSLPILDNLATQLIQKIAKASHSEIQDMMRGATDAEDSQAFTTLKSLFDQTRKVYSRETAFIDAVAIQMLQPSQQEVMRKANIATFVASILGSHDVSFFHLNEYFLETFVPLGHRLLKWQGAILLELKTQTYISALMNSDGGREAMLDELFPTELDAQILARHPDAPSLSPSEQDFVDRCKSRKSYLLAEAANEEALSELPNKYQWNDFIRELAASINKNVDGILNIPLRSHNIFGSTQHRRPMVHTSASVREALAGQQGVMVRDSPQSNALASVSSMPSLQHQTSSGAEKKPSNNAPARQPWTEAEQEALLSGLDKVNGPHWSQILALYGRGGSISEVLKDRNQVQLKDKARNLKLWYLKMGKEVPGALQGVTGELRKRGGARARAAMGLLDDDQDGLADAVGEEVESFDSGLGSKSARAGKKKKGRR